MVRLQAIVQPAKKVTFTLLILTLFGAGITCGDMHEAKKRPRSSAAPSVIEEVLRIVLNRTDIRQYYHLGHEGRDTLFVVYTGLPDGIELQERGSPVILSSTIERENALQITRFCLTLDTVALAFQYDREGMFGNFKFAKEGTNWTLVDSLLAEW